MNKTIVILLLLLTAAAFVVFMPPNAAASENMAMVRMFEPDESEPLPYLLDMIDPSPNLDQALRDFVFYSYYYYGFPYFAVSALAVLPIQLTGHISNLPLVMGVLRQVVSVLPMLLGLLLLVYMQDQFRTYRSVLLYGFLLAVPAVVSNNFWWHPDGLTFLFAMLTLFFLNRDDLRFGKNFLLAAVFTGITAATKLVGFYFFLAVALTLVLGLRNKQLSWKRFVKAALLFLGIMVVSFVVANPFLLSHWARIDYFSTFTQQTKLLAEGYGILYDKGLSAAWPTIRQYYGMALFLLCAAGTAIAGALQGKRRLLYALILAWFVPLTITVLWQSHFKFQYWLPVALPLFSCVAMLFPEKIKDVRWKNWKAAVHLILIAVVLCQLVLFAIADSQAYSNRLHRAEDNERIAFYAQALEVLSPLEGSSLHVYYDYRLYAPELSAWKLETRFDLLDYDTIRENDFDVLLLLDQRIRDYLSPDAVGINPAQFAQNQRFYRDADAGSIAGYHLLYRDTVGLIYISDELYAK